MGRAKGSYSRSKSNSDRDESISMAKHSFKRKKSPSPSRSRSRSKHRRYSRSRSRSYHRRYRSHSRSRSYDRYRSDRYDDRRRESRSPMSRRKRHQGDRERPKTSRCLGVFGLSLYTQEQDLKQLFEKYGPVDDLQIVYDHQTGKSRGFAFIYMHNLQDAVDAKEMAPGTEVDGRPIRVDYSITERAHTPTPGVYLGKPTVSRSGGYRPERGRSPYYNSRRYSRSHSRSRSRSHYRY